MRHDYVQVNVRGEFQSGHGPDEMRLTEDKRIRLVDSWEWESQPGFGLCIRQELRPD